VEEQGQNNQLVELSQTKDKSSSQEFHEDTFTIFLDIEGTNHEKYEYTLENPYQTIRELVKCVVRTFKLPLYDSGGNPIQYLLGYIGLGSDEPFILDIEDEDGRERSLLDYHIVPGDQIYLISVPVAGGVEKMQINYLPEKRSIFKRVFGRKSGVSFASAFLPDTVSRGGSMMIQVYLYSSGERDIVCAEATHCDHFTEEKSFVPLYVRLKKGDKITVNLRIRNLEVERSSKSIIWQGHYTKACFHAFIDHDWKEDNIYGEIFISINNTIIGELDFITNVISDYVKIQQTAKIISRQYKKVFISYAHQDESKVKYIAEAYRAQGIDYFFDRHYLKGGDIFPLVIQDFISNADLFFLCWSENAANSEYVEKERKQALQRAFPNVQPSETTGLTIYPVSIEPYAELPEDMKDYYNFEQL
jgi:hypothetical protein